MTVWEFFESFWWIFPLVMIVLCFLMMRGGRGPMMCGFGSRWGDSGRESPRDSARDTLEKRYVRGEIDRTEYEEKRGVLAGGNESHTT